VSLDVVKPSDDSAVAVVEVGPANFIYVDLCIGQIRQRTRCKLLCQSSNPKAWITILELTFRIDTSAICTNDLDGLQLLEPFGEAVVLLLHLGNDSVFLERQPPRELDRT
jgi:hypothetical protein